MAAISDTLKASLDQAAQTAIQQEKERKQAQQHLLESLNSIEGHVGEFWDQLGIQGSSFSCVARVPTSLITENSVAKLLAQQEQASVMQSETVETLQKLNATFQFLLSVTENSREQLNWIQSLVANTGKLQLSFFICWTFLNIFALFQRKNWASFQLGLSTSVTSSWACFFWHSHKHRATLVGSSL